MLEFKLLYGIEGYTLTDVYKRQHRSHLHYTQAKPHIHPPLWIQNPECNRSFELPVHSSPIVFPNHSLTHILYLVPLLRYSNKYCLYRRPIQPVCLSLPQPRAEVNRLYPHI